MHVVGTSAYGYMIIYSRVYVYHYDHIFYSIQRFTNDAQYLTITFFLDQRINGNHPYSRLPII